jgi:hypothetical protein
MAGKYSVIIKYKYLDYIESAELSDSDTGILFKAIVRYDKAGESPVFENPVLTGMFAIIKHDIDENKKKWEEEVIRNRENGKRGGRPSKTQQNPKNPAGFQETKRNPTKPKKADYDLDHDLDKREREEFNAEKNTEPPENQTFSTADAVVLDSPDLPPEKPDIPPENIPVSQNKPPSFSPVDSPPKKQNKLELTPEQSELYRAAKACFEASDRAKAIMYQDDQSAKMQMRKLKEIIIRCWHIAPGITVDFLQSVLEHFKVMTNSAKYQGSWVFTPRCLSTHWIWEIVISSLPERETELDRTIQARIKGLFRGG